MIRSSCMGVLNVTPNSFSDPGKFLNNKQTHSTIVHWLKCGVRYFDFGAQSTAPFNEPIDASEEWQRVENHVLPLLSLFPDNASISLDTYRVETFQKFYDHVKGKRYNLKLLFNDISGAIDDDLILFLKSHPDIDYIYSHNLSPSRSLSFDHMEYVSSLKESEFLDSFISHFRRGLETFKSKGISNKVYLDPCFGFSKTKEQNLFLLKNISFLIENLDAHFILGVSKKSFLQGLQFSELSKDEKREKSEFIHSVLIYKTLRDLSALNFSHELLFRVHDPHVYHNGLVALSEFG